MLPVDILAAVNTIMYNVNIGIHKMSTFVERKPSVYHQIAEHIEQQIRQGILRPGQKLPPTQDLAQEFGVAMRTIQRSMEILARRTLITRIPRQGSFVNKHINTRTLGMLVNSEVFTQCGYEFHQSLLHTIRRLALDRGWNSQIYFLDSARELSSVLPLIKDDIRNGKIRGIIAVNARNYYHELALDTTFPWCTTRAAIDYRRLAYDMCRYLLSRGYRNIMLIRHSEGHSKGKDVDGALQYEGYMEAMREAGVSVPPYGRGILASFARPAFEGLNRLLVEAGDNRIEAVMVMNDRATEGVVMALLNNGLKIPEDVALITHANRHIEILSPVELTRYEFDIMDFAKVALDGFEAILEGEEIEDIVYLPGTLIEGEST
ncbi:MAG: GntR family transcriptional regulator [Lentisphaerae bacterium]|nr:MAG: GntR family transcriptional regulator [Lentisphaerota bacterium]